MKKAFIIIALSIFIPAYIAFTVIKQSGDLPSDFDFKHLVVKYNQNPSLVKGAYKIGSGSLTTLLPGEQVRQGKKKVYWVSFAAFLISLYPAWKTYKKQQFYR
jgi:hypothetical protein